VSFDNTLGNGWLSKSLGTMPNFTNWSISFWFKLLADNGTGWSHLFSRGNSTSGRAVDVKIVDFSGLTISSSDGADAPNGTHIDTGRWYHCAVTKRGTSAIVYCNGKREAGTPFALNADNATGDKMVMFRASDEISFAFSGRIAHFKQWSNIVLGPDDVRREMMSVAPRNAAGLYQWTPLRFGPRDVSGRANDWTENSPVYKADEPRIVSAFATPAKAGVAALPVKGYAGLWDPELIVRHWF
jgi:hypothetical protein